MLCGCVSEELPEFAMAGALFALSQGVMSRPAVAANLLELDAIAVFTDILRQVSPAGRWGSIRTVQNTGRSILKEKGN